MPSKLEPQLDQIKNDIAAGLSQRELARKYDVGRTTLREFLQAKGLATTGLATPAARSLMSFSAELRAQADAITVIRRNYRHMDSLRVYPMGDFHVGSAAHEGDLLEDWLDYIIETPNATILNTGDNLNCAIPGSKSDQFEEKLQVDDGLLELERLLGPIAAVDRLDMIFDGNHEARVYRATGIRLSKLLGQRLGVPWCTTSAVLIYEVGDQEYTFYVRHGTGNSPASMQAIVKSGNVTQADVYVTGHTHRQSVVLEDFIVVQDGQPVRLPRRYVTSGSFTGYEAYASERGYAPSHAGAPRIFLDGTRHDVHVSI